jgi:hypothetical protein
MDITIEPFLDLIANIQRPLQVVGLALVILLLLYKYVLEEKILDRFKDTHAFKITRLLITYVFITVIFSIAAMLLCEMIYRRNNPEPNGNGPVPVEVHDKLEFSNVDVLKSHNDILRFFVNELGYAYDAIEHKKYNYVIDITIQNMSDDKVLFSKVRLCPLHHVAAKPPLLTHSLCPNSAGTFTNPYRIDLTNPEFCLNAIVREIDPGAYSRVVLISPLLIELGENPLERIATLELTVYSDKEAPFKYEEPLEVVLYSPDVNAPHRQPPDDDTEKVTLDSLIQEELKTMEILIEPVVEPTPDVSPDEEDVTRD